MPHLPVCRLLLPALHQSSCRGRGRSLTSFHPTGRACSQHAWLHLLVPPPPLQAPAQQRLCTGQEGSPAVSVHHAAAAHAALHPDAGLRRGHLQAGAPPGQAQHGEGQPCHQQPTGCFLRTLHCGVLVAAKALWGTGAASRASSCVPRWGFLHQALIVGWPGLCACGTAALSWLKLQLMNMLQCARAPDADFVLADEDVVDPHRPHSGED